MAFLIGGEKLARYNHGKKYNQSDAIDGAKYNTVAYVYALRVTDSFKVVDELEGPTASYLFTEALKLKEDFQLSVEHLSMESLNIKETDVHFEVLFEIFESLGLKDEFTGLVTLLSAMDKTSVLDEITAVDREFFDSVVFTETPDINAIISAADNIGLKEASALFAAMKSFEPVNVIDKTPKSSISDFYITKDEQGICDIIMPFNLIVDYSKSNIGFIPEAIDTSTTLAGVDGEIVQDTVYGSRLFDIFAVTEPGLSIPEKEEIKREIAEILHSIKKGTRVLTFANNETAFDVKYSGQAEIDTDAPGWLRFSLPLKSASSYGHKQFTKDKKGSGLLDNTGDVEVGPVITITGPVSSPGFTIGDMDITWNGMVAEDEKLVIDMQNETCYKVLANNTRQNAMKNFAGDFKKIPVGSIVLQANTNTEEHISATWIEKVLY